MGNRKESNGRSLRDRSDPLPLFSIDDCLEGGPAAGYRNGTSRNNDGENGNYWSATPNEENTNNAYNLNFNSDNFNRNWNNRNNGQSVRSVSELTQMPSSPPHPDHFSISKEQLLLDLYRAYKDARQHKRGKSCQLCFEYHLEENLVALRDELFSRTYKPLPSICFVVHDPKMREVFAADFRDRIVHHLFYNYTHSLFERTFISDSYSCIKGRGIHYGISRLKHHIRSVSAGYSKPVYGMQIDIRGYFMHIDRTILLSVCRNTLKKMEHRPSRYSGAKWGDVLDYDFVNYLLETIINTNPLEGCHRLGKPEEWDKLPSDKSIFYSPAGCGLPIGNLTSQLFSNVYLNLFDQFMKRQLGCKHYGRYVDDCYVIADSREWLGSLVPQIREFLQTTLHLEINEKKLKITNLRYGVEFLGAYIMPFRTYISNSALRRIRYKIKYGDKTDHALLGSRVNSFLGTLSHHKSYRIRRILFGYSSKLYAFGRFSKDWLTFRPQGK